MTSTTPKVEKKRLTADYIHAHLRAFYRTPRKVTFNKFCTTKNIKPSNLGKIFRESGLAEMKQNNIDVDVAMQTLTEFINQRKKRNTKKMKKLHENNEYLTGDEVLLVINLAKVLGAMGYGIDKSVCLDIITSVLKIRQPAMESIAPTTSVVNLMIKKNNDIIQLVHGNAIDPARIRQATEEVRDAEFYKIEKFIEMLFKMGLIPWKTYKDIPNRNLYNADEVATNTYDHRRKVIASATEMGRVFQITPGGDGRMPFHITSMITSCATGHYKVPIQGFEGAPPPMIIHACSASPDKKDSGEIQTANNAFFQHPRYSDGLAEPFSVAGADEVSKNPWGFCVRTSQAGSMTQRTFFDYCLHFVKHIPDDQGENGEPVILFLDGHSSRWDVSSLLYLLQNKVFPFFLPSHTSVWTQPNDNGTNLRWVKSLETAVSSLGMRWNGVSTTPSYFNIIIRNGWKIFLKSEREDLLCCNCNNTTSAWKKTGLYPFNPFCESWNNVLETMGPLNRRYKETRGETGVEYEITLKKHVVPLSDGERKAITSSSGQDNHIQAAYFHMRKILSDWKRRSLFDPSTKPNPTSGPEIISCRLFEFVERSGELITFVKKAIQRKGRNSEKNEETEKQDKIRQLLSSTPLTSSLPLTFTYFVATNIVGCCDVSHVDGHAVKLTKDSFVIYLEDQRPPFNVKQQRLLQLNTFQVHRPEFIFSSEEKDKMSRRRLRESKRKEEIKIRKRKEAAEKARKKWILCEYNKMVTQIKENKHTFQDFTGLFGRYCQPFEHISSDGYVTHCTTDQSICVSTMALKAIDGVLCQKRQAEELARINALAKKRKSCKRKRTPNTTRGDDGIGVYMGLQDFDVTAEQEKRADNKERLSKDVSRLEKILQDFEAMRLKYNGSINVHRCYADELSTLLNVCGLAKGTSGKNKECKKQILLEKNITCERIMTFVGDETKRLTEMKEKLARGVVEDNREEDAMSVGSESSDSDDEP